MMKKLILNADDFGRHTAINQAVKQGVEQGILSSASLMPGEKCFDEAVEIARELPRLEVGVHLTLVDGRPVSDPSKIPSLVDGEGRFCPDHKEFVKRFFLGKINLQEVAGELKAQIDKVVQQKLRLTHVDGHQHIHILPGILPIVLELARQAGIGGVRIPRVNVNVDTGKSQGGMGEIVGRMGLWTLASFGAYRTRRAGFVVPEHFAGLVAGTAADEDYILKLLPILLAGTTEIMTHPGLNNEVLKGVYGLHGWDHDFEAEYKAIVSPRVAEAMEKWGIGIGSFAQ